MSRSPLVSSRWSDRRGPLRAMVWSLWCVALLPLALRADAPLVPPLRAFIVGGGPDKENNQAAIESNVRYVGRLLPPETVRTTLFADGDADHASVLYDEEVKPASFAERVLMLLLRGHGPEDEGVARYRKPDLGKLDGASRNREIVKAFTQLSQEAVETPRPLFLYFTGHGSPNKKDLENNVYDLWGKSEDISVRVLAKQIARLPEETPVTIVMVQCFSGAFGNLLFEDGDPQGKSLHRDIAGFFATVKERVAAGCTSAVNEAEYHDFTSYFFAALTGRDRVGRRVTGADYNHDGRVGMDEAFCYTLANDESIDVPICTSDVFLRRFVSMKDTEIMQTPFHDVTAWATPAQHAALDALSQNLKLSGEDRLAVAYDKMIRGGDSKARLSTESKQAHTQFQTLRQQARRTLWERWPDLKHPGTSAYETAEKEAREEIGHQEKERRWKDVLDAYTAWGRAEMASEAQDIAESRTIRFVRLGKSVVLAHRLQESRDPALKARFARLIEAEGRTLLPPAEPLPRAAARVVGK